MTTSYDIETFYLIGWIWKDDSTGTANVCADYGHVILTPSEVSLSYAKNSGVSFSVAWHAGIEEAVTAYTSFSY